MRLLVIIITITISNYLMNLAYGGAEIEVIYAQVIANLVFIVGIKIEERMCD